MKDDVNCLLCKVETLILGWQGLESQLQVNACLLNMSHRPTVVSIHGALVRKLVEAIVTNNLLKGPSIECLGCQVHLEDSKTLEIHKDKGSNLATANFTWVRLVVHIQHLPYSELRDIITVEICIEDIESGGVHGKPVNVMNIIGIVHGDKMGLWERLWYARLAGESFPSGLGLCTSVTKLILRGDKLDTVNMIHSAVQFGPMAVVEDAVSTMAGTAPYSTASRVVTLGGLVINGWLVGWLVGC